MTNRTVNPFYSSRRNALAAHAGRPPRKRPQYALLPEAPMTASPVPELTSLYHSAVPGNYGDRRYPGNCGGNLIRDLLRFYEPARVFDPMSGSGTCRDVCLELDVPCDFTDLKSGRDACDPAGFGRDGTYDFIWAHPPYYRQKIYSDDPRDMSQARSVEEFLARYGQFIRNCTDALTVGGRLAILMGDYNDREAGHVPLTYHTKRLAFESGLIQDGTEIIRFSHGASSSRKVYRSRFIPGLHDVCVIFRRPRSP